MMKKQLKWFKYVLFLLFFLCLMYAYLGNVGVVREYISQNIDDGLVGEITARSEVQQTFYSDQNNLSGVSIKLATYGRVNEGSVVVAIRKKGSNFNIYETVVKAKSIRDNEFFNLRFPPIKSSKGVTYSIYIKAIEAKPGHAITAYKSEAESYLNGELYINGDKQNGDLTFKAYYNRNVFNYLEEKFREVI